MYLSKHIYFDLCDLFLIKGGSCDTYIGLYLIQTPFEINKHVLMDIVMENIRAQVPPALTEIIIMIIIVDNVCLNML